MRVRRGDGVDAFRIPDGLDVVDEGEVRRRFRGMVDRALAWPCGGVPWPWRRGGARSRVANGQAGLGRLGRESRNQEPLKRLKRSIEVRKISKKLKNLFSAALLLLLFVKVLLLLLFFFFTQSVFFFFFLCAIAKIELNKPCLPRSLLCS